MVLPSTIFPASRPLSTKPSFFIFHWFFRQPPPLKGPFIILSCQQTLFARNSLIFHLYSAKRVENTKPWLSKLKGENLLLPLTCKINLAIISLYSTNSISFQLSTTWSAARMSHFVVKPPCCQA